MKCAKCGYVGFEPADRCRNCGYQFALASGFDLDLTTPAAAPSGLDDYTLVDAAASRRVMTSMKRSGNPWCVNCPFCAAWRKANSRA
mgnify:CR=1 FL=1